MTGSLGRRYARALLGLVRESGALAAIGEELGRAAMIIGEPRVRAVVLNPGIAAAARRTIVGKAVDALGVSPMVGNLIRLLADRDRLAILSDVAREYDVLVDRELGRSRVKIRSASPLGAGEIARLDELAQRLTGSRQIIATTEVRPDLIGGVILDAAGTVYDGSVKTQLVRLSKQMVGDGA